MTTKQRIGVLLLLCGLPACQNLPRPPGMPSFLPPDGVQEGEVTVPDGEEVAVRYPRAYEAPPRLVVVEFRKSWFKEKPYAKSDFVFVRQDALGFRVLNNHPEQGRGSVATVLWRAEGVIAARQPAPPPPTPKTAREQLLDRIKGLGGTFVVEPRQPDQPVIGLDLHHTRVGDADLEQFQGLTALRSLNLSGTRITDAGLKSVGGLMALQSLHLNETAVTNAGLEYLQRLTDLHELSLFHTHVSDDGLATLSRLTGLRDLSLGGRNVTDRGLAQLSGLRNLKHLYLSDTAVTPTGVRELKRALPRTEVVQ